MKIYLNGPRKGDWMEKVIDAVQDIQDGTVFFDPRNYPANDLPGIVERVEECDFMFAYIDTKMLTLGDIAFEICLAVQHGKKIILVNKTGEPGSGILHLVSESFHSLDSALAALPFMEIWHE
ncbi:MAG: hypothetical protein GY906_03745 [bacterium]|nr:hypothetical protein [bacterium]